MSEDMTWQTPQALFDWLNEQFEFNLDAAALQGSAKCDAYYGPDHVDESRRDALAVDWVAFDSEPPRAFLNPPYGRAIGHFLAKAVEQSAEGATVVALVPARTDTRWFNDHIWEQADEVWFIRGRVHFGEPGSSCAPFPSCIAIFYPSEHPDKRKLFAHAKVYAITCPRKDVVA